MSERLTRGYAIQQIADYIDRTYDADARARLYEAIPGEVRTMLPDLKPTAWYPWEFNAGMLRGVASIGSDEASVYAELVKCGESIATEATNTFLRFLMKILTPTVFAKKVPDFWRRDNKSGALSSDTSEASEGRIRMSLSDVGGYDHIGAATVGWITFGMKATGKDVTVEQSGWSLDNPAPERVDYTITWSV